MKGVIETVLSEQEALEYTVYEVSGVPEITKDSIVNLALDNANDVKYIEVIGRNDALLGENHAGSYLYETSAYQYIIEPEGRFVEAIYLREIDKTQNTISTLSVDSENQLIITNGRTLSIIL